MRLLEKLSDKAAGRATAVLLAASAVLLCVSLYLIFFGDGGETVTTYSMGSYVEQTVYGKEKSDAAAKAASEITRLESLISWRMEDSDTARINANAGGEFVEISDETTDIFNTVLPVCEASGGAFDITIAPLSLLWDFDENPHLPEAEQIEEFVRYIDYSRLILRDDGTAALKNKGYALDLGAVGKGAACDMAVEIYSQYDIDRAVISVGGSVGVYGEKPFGKKWQVAVRDPKSQGSFGTLEIGSGFLSTSGSYEKRFEENGKAYHHILDPETGYPAESGLISVTVWSESGALSDALSTACFVLGMKESLPVLEKFDAQAIFIDENDGVFITEGLWEDFHPGSSDYPEPQRVSLTLE